MLFYNPYHHSSSHPHVAAPVFQGDMVLLARLYLKKRASDTLDEFYMPEQGGQEPTLYDEETCVAWAALPLVKCDDSTCHAQGVDYLVK